MARLRYQAALALLFLALGSLRCKPERDDVEPTIVSWDLAVQAPGDLAGVVVGHYENLGDISYVIQRPELQLKRDDGTVTSIDLVFPTGFDPSFESGEVAEASFTVADSGGWTPWCGRSVEAELHHQGVDADGVNSTSMGPEVSFILSCQP